MINWQDKQQDLEDLQSRCKYHITKKSLINFSPINSNRSLLINKAKKFNRKMKKLEALIKYNMLKTKKWKQKKRK